MTGSNFVGPRPPRTPRWRRELRLLRRDGPWRWARGLYLLRRFHKSVAAMDAEPTVSRTSGEQRAYVEGYDDAMRLANGDYAPDEAER